MLRVWATIKHWLLPTRQEDAKPNGTLNRATMRYIELERRQQALRDELLALRRRRPEG